MFEMMFKSTMRIAKIGVMVTIFVLTSACSHEVIKPTRSFEPIQDSEQTPKELSYATSSTTKRSSKKFKHKASLATRRKLAKRVRAEALVKSHNEKVSALAQGSLSTEIPLPPAPNETPAVVNGPTASQPLLTSQVAKWNSFDGIWPYGLATGLAIAWFALASQLRRLRAKGRRLIYNS